MQKRIWNVPEPEPAFMITEKKGKDNGFSFFCLKPERLRNPLNHGKIQAYRPGNGAAYDCAGKPDLSFL